MTVPRLLANGICTVRVLASVSSALGTRRPASPSLLFQFPSCSVASCVTERSLRGGTLTVSTRLLGKSRSLMGREVAHGEATPELCVGPCSPSPAIHQAPYDHADGTANGR